MNKRRRFKQKYRARIARLLRMEDDVRGVSDMSERWRLRRILWSRMDGTPPPRY